MDHRPRVSIIALIKALTRALRALLEALSAVLLLKTLMRVGVGLVPTHESDGQALPPRQEVVQPLNYIISGVLLSIPHTPLHTRHNHPILHDHIIEKRIITTSQAYRQQHHHHHPYNKLLFIYLPNIEKVLK